MVQEVQEVQIWRGVRDTGEYRYKRCKLESTAPCTSSTSLHSVLRPMTYSRSDKIWGVGRGIPGQIRCTGDVCRRGMPQHTLASAS